MRRKLQRSGRLRRLRSWASRLLLLQSVSWKLAGLGLGALSDRAARRERERALSGAERGLPTRPEASSYRAKALQLGTGVAWSMASLNGSWAFLVDRREIKPWMFYTESLAYGAVGLRSGAQARRLAATPEPEPTKADLFSQESGKLRRRAKIFLAAGAIACGAGYLLARLRAAGEA